MPAMREQILRAVDANDTGYIVMLAKKITALKKRKPDPLQEFLIENWVSGEHLDAHLAAPHLVDFVGKMPDLLDENGLTVNRVRRIA